MSLRDKLFGRERLKEKIKALEQELSQAKEEVGEMEEKLKREGERAKKAITQKQELDEKINRQEDKIQSLKDEIRKKEYVKETMGKTFQSSRISRAGLKSLLGKLGSMRSEKEDLFTAFLPKGATIGSLDSDGALRTDLTLNQLKALKEEESETGKALFYSKNLVNLLLKPPLPVQEEVWHKSQEFKVSPIKKQLETRVGYIFLSAGGSGLAVFGEELEDFKLIGSKIKSKHKKGGYSQGRFERRRNEEAKQHLNKVEEVAEEFFPGSLKWFALSGSSELINRFKEGKWLEGKKSFARKMNLSKIERGEDLQRAFREFWKVEIKHI